ncbi:MAG TPA: D-alanyl-D-alanine carboxypeptidase family protein [Alphaproteobacteria bacterium]|nr:D-alanyl-D-alanine carboxypeptidase family protein [Alphaproteobacteria bacterium]
MSRFIFILAFVLATLANGPGRAAPAEGTNTTPAREAIVVDYDTGTVLFEKNADQRMPTSSMSKTLTAYVIFEALRDGKLTLDQTLPVSEKAWRMQGSKMFVALDSQVSVQDLIRGVIIQSGNDATIVLAEGLAGDESRFAEMMNAKAAQMGMKNSHFVNASGWPDPNHYSTARDLAILGSHIVRDFPEYYKWYSETEFKYNNIRQYNRNPLLRHGIGADGIKTGHAEEAGYGLIGSGVRNGRRVVLVVNGLPDMKARENESVRLLEWALSAFENRPLFKKGEGVIDAPVVLGLANSVPLVCAENVTVTAPKNATSALKAEAVYNAPLRAPIRKGDRVGVLRVQTPLLGAQEWTLVAADDVPASGFFRTAWQKMRLRFFGIGRDASPPSDVSPAAGIP